VFLLVQACGQLFAAQPEQSTASLERGLCRRHRVPDPCARTVDFHSWSSAWGVSEWDDNGDDILPGKWSLFSTVTGGPGGGATVTSDRLGSLAPPNWPSSDPGGNGRGYAAVPALRTVIGRWDVPGGFEYL